MQPESTSLVDAYHKLSDEIRRLEARREFVRAQLLLAIADSPGVHRGSSGAVRLSVLPTARFPPGPTMERLDRARLLPGVATVSALRLRRAMDERPGYEALLADIVQRVDLPYLAAVPK